MIASLWSSIDAVWSSPLLRRAAAEAALVGVLGGVIGVHVSLRRLAFTTMALTHATFPGVVIASLLGWNLVLGSSAFGLLVVAAIALAGGLGRLDHTTTTGVILAGGMALGVVLVSVQDGFSTNLSAYLVGSVLSTSGSDLALTAAISAVVCGFVLAAHRPLVASAFDPAGVRAAGLAASAVDVGFLVVLVVTLATAVPAVGTILSVSLVVAPAATARLWTDRVGTMLVISPVIGALCGAGGVILSHWWDTSAGATIAAVAGAVFVGSTLISPSTVSLRSPGRSARRRTALR